MIYFNIILFAVESIFPPNLMLRKLTLLFSICALTACATVRAPDIRIPVTQPLETLPKTPPRVALVLGSGGVRSFAALGVLKVLEENHIPIDLIVGASAGSLIGGLYADNPNIDALIPKMLVLKPCDLLHIRLFNGSDGFDNGYTLQKFMLKNLKAYNFDQLKIKFVAVATDFITGKTIPLVSGPIAPAVNASSAFPSIFIPVFLYGHLLVDGGISDGVPVDVAKHYHPQLIIAVNAAPNPGNLTHRGIIANITRAYLLQIKSFTRLQMQEADIIIAPEVGTTWTFDFNARRRMGEAGRQSALAALPQIKKMLRAKKIALNR